MDPITRRHRRRPAARAPDGRRVSRSTICRRRSRQRLDVALDPYVVSFRADANGPAHRRLPMPGRSSPRACGRAATGRGPTAGSRGVDVVHGTNYVVPPSRLPTVVSVYDCGSCANRERQLRRRAIVQASGAATCGDARRVRARQLRTTTAEVARDLLGTDRVEVVHLGSPAAVRHRWRPRRSRPSGSTGDRSSWRSARRAPQGAADARRRVRSSSPSTLGDCVLVHGRRAGRRRDRRRARRSTRSARRGPDRV